LSFAQYAEQRQLDQVVGYRHTFWHGLVRMRDALCSKAAVDRYVREIHGPKGVRKIVAFRSKCRQLVSMITAVLDESAAASKPPPHQTLQQLLEQLIDNVAQLQKRWYILYRLCFQAEQLLRTGTLAIWYPQHCNERQFLMTHRTMHLVASSSQSLSEQCTIATTRARAMIEQEFDNLLAQLESKVDRISSALADCAKLPDVPASASQWLQDIRHATCAYELEQFQSKRHSELTSMQPEPMYHELFDRVRCALAHDERLLWLGRIVNDEQVSVVGIYCQNPNELLQSTPVERSKIDSEQHTTTASCTVVCAQTYET
jgi:hypothetical protein